MKQTVIFLVLTLALSSVALAHYCSCFPGSADFSGYMCTYSNPKIPLFDEKTQSFSFTLTAEQLKSNVGCVVKDNRHDCTKDSGCELDCVFDHCAVPIAISNFKGEMIKCERNEGSGWNPCKGDEFEFTFGNPDKSEIGVKTDKKIIGSTINEKCGSSPYGIRIPTQFKVKEQAISADYRITIRTTWDPDVYAPCEFKEPGIDSSCKGATCGKFLRESYSDFIVTVSLKEKTGTISNLGGQDSTQCQGESACAQDQKTQDDFDMKKSQGSSKTLVYISIGVAAALIVIGMIFFFMNKSKGSSANISQFGGGR